MPDPTPIQDVLHELAATATYLQESGRLMREAVQHLLETEQHLIATEERIEKNNTYMQVVVERIEKAITAALRVADGDPPARPNPRQPLE